MPAAIHSAELAPPPRPSDGTDPELEALPEPRRPWRRLTLVVMATTALVSLAMAWNLRGEALYAAQNGPPIQLGELGNAVDGRQLANRWVQGAAQLETSGAIRYSRPLESDTFRLARVAGASKLWVEIRVPAGLEGPHFVAPASFVGHLVPFSRAGLRHRGLPAEVIATTNERVPPDAWLLVDGESPRGVGWAAGLVVLFLGFFAFNLFGVYRIIRPVRDA
jgi:hypothetical protein